MGEETTSDREPDQVAPTGFRDLAEHPCGHLYGCALHIRYLVPALVKAPAAVSVPSVALSSSEPGIPDIHFVDEFIVDGA